MISKRRIAAKAAQERRRKRAQQVQESLEHVDSEATVLPGQSVGELFANMVEDISIAMLPGEDNQPAHKVPVDVELKFKSASVDGGGLIFNRKKEESSIEITLSTRVMPPDD